jgi:hypothetical protein
MLVFGDICWKVVFSGDCRQQDPFKKKMNVAGYVEKVPNLIHEEFRPKSTKLTAELQTIEDITANFHRVNF